MVSPVGDKFFDRDERCSPASCLPIHSCDIHTLFMFSQTM